MKSKLIITLAAVAFILASCTKNDDVQTLHAASLKQVPLQITLSMPDPIVPASGTRVSIFELSDASNPLKLIGKWKKYTRVMLVVFQGEAEDWKTVPSVMHTFEIPLSADGQTTANLTAAAGNINLSELDATKPIKYMIGVSSDWRPQLKYTSFGNAYFAPFYTSGLASADEKERHQLEDMILASDVTEAPFPTAGNPLQLTAKLKWMTAVLAVHFSFEGFNPDHFMIDATGNDLYPFFLLCLRKKGGEYIYPNETDLVRRKAITTANRNNFYFGTSFSKPTATKFTESLGVGGAPAGMRYFTIPASNTIEGINVDGSELWMGRAKYSSTNGDFSDNIAWQNSPNAYKVTDFPANVKIEAGKCYGIKLKFVKVGDKLVLKRAS